MKIKALLFTAAFSLGALSPLIAGRVMEGDVSENVASGYFQAGVTSEIGRTKAVERDVYMPSALEGKACLIYDNETFSVLFANDEIYNISPYNVKGFPEGLSSEALFNGNFYFRVKEHGSGYALDINARLRGGGERWDGFKTWLVGPHPGWGVFKDKVLPQIAEGAVVVIKTIVNAKNQK